MGNISKSFSLLLVLILAGSSLSLLMVKPACAQSVPVPTVPQFTLKFTDRSYDVAPTTTATTDPYNGKTTTTAISGYHVRNFTIDLTIKNQPFPPTINGNYTGLSYYVRMKGHFEEDWIPNGSYATTLQPASNSEYTILSFPANGYQPNDEIDFQLQAVLGYTYTYYDYSHPPLRFPASTFVSNSSDWSDIQTITIPASSASASSNPTLSPSPTPTVPEFPLWTIPLLFIIMVSVGLLISFKKCKQRKFG